MLLETLDRIKRNAVMGAIVLMFAGVMLMVTPSEKVSFLGDVVAFALAVYAVVSVLEFADGRRTIVSCMRLTVGLVAGVAAIALFVFDGLFSQLISWLVGTIPILVGAYGLYYAFAYARRSGRRGWWVLVVLTGLLVIFGGFVFWNPWMGSPQAAMRVVGGTLIYSAVVSALSLVWLWPVPGRLEA